MATEEDKQAARDRLTELTGRYETAETHLEQVRKEVTEEIGAILMARTLGPSEVTRLSPFERQHVGRIAKAAGVPPLREPTVVSRRTAQSARPDQAPRPSASPPLPAKRTEPSPAAQKPEPRAEERPLADEEVAEYATLARSRASEQQLKKLEQDTSGRPDRLKDFIVFSSAMGMGLLKHDEVYATAKPERPVSSEEKAG